MSSHLSNIIIHISGDSRSNENQFGYGVAVAMALGAWSKASVFTGIDEGDSIL